MSDLSVPNNSPDQQVELPAPKAEPDRVFHSTSRGELRKRTLDFSYLRTQHPQTDPLTLFREHPSNSDIQDLRRVVTGILHTWVKVEQQGLYAIPYTLEKLFDYITMPGARTTLLEVVSPDQKESVELVGAVVTHINNFVVTPPFPIDRHGVLLYINDHGRELGPRGKAIDYLVSDSLENLGDGRIGTRVVSGPSEIAHIQNQITYRRFGFEPTGVVENVPGKHKGHDITVTYEWWVYPPFSNRAKEAFSVQKQKDKESQLEIAIRVADLTPFIPTAGGVVAYVGPNKGTGYDLAAALPQDTIFSINSSLEALSKSPEPRSNLYHFHQNSGHLALPDHELGALIISDAFNDLIRRGESPVDFILRASQKLSHDGGRIIVQDQNSLIPLRDIERFLQSQGFRIISSNQPQDSDYFTLCAERKPGGAPIRVECVHSEIVAAPTFLTISSYRNTETGHTFQLASRPNQTLDIAPFNGDNVYVQEGKPRPHLVNVNTGIRLSPAYRSPYSIEQISAIRNVTDPATAALETLYSGYGITLDNARMSNPFLYLTLPTEIDELVVAQPLELPHLFESLSIKNNTGIEQRGAVRMMSAQRFLQSCQRGAISDERVARMIYVRGLEANCEFSSWIGRFPDMSIQGEARVPISTFEDLVPEKGRAVFVSLDVDPELPYFAVGRAHYVEVDSKMNTVSSSELEYVTPSDSAVIKHNASNFKISNNSVVVVPYIKANDGILIGLGKRDSATVQIHSQQMYGYQSSQFFSMPFFNLPTTILNHDHGKRFIEERLSDGFGLSALGCTVLGNTFMATPGASLRAVSVYAMKIDQEAVRHSSHNLSWVRLEECLRHFSDPAHRENRKFWIDGPTVSGLFRMAHASGLIGK